MHINDLETAADLFRLIKLIDGGEWMAVKTIQGEVVIPKDVQGAFAGTIKRLAYQNLDRLGIERPAVMPENAERF